MEVIEQKAGRNRLLVGFVFLVFFVIALITNVMGPIIPDIIRVFRISLRGAAFLPFSFFIAYAVMSIPAGMLVEGWAEKPVLLAAFAAAFLGAVSFAVLPVYGVAIASLFLIGGGMAMLQVALNPLLRVAGGEEHFAFNSTIVQLVFGAGSFLSPLAYTYVVANPVLARAVPERLPWVALYWLFAAIALSMIAAVAFMRFPSVDRKDDERTGTWLEHARLLRSRMVMLYFASIFAYVGCEQGTANWMSQFLSTYHRFDPQTTGAIAVSRFWGLMTLGCLAGLAVLKLFDSRRVLIGASCGAIAALTAALFGPASWSLAAFPAIGLFASVMWPVLISLGLNSVAEAHGAVAGILCTGIAGGALTPVIVGWIGDHLGLRIGLSFLYVTFAWVLGVGFWARPIIRNATIRG